MENNDILSGNTYMLTPNPIYYKVNIDKIETLEDIKLILKHLNLNYTPKDKEEYEEIKHLLILN